MHVVIITSSPVQEHEEGRHDQEDEVGDSVEELGDERREGVVLLAPVHGGAAPVQMAEHGETFYYLSTTPVLLDLKAKGKNEGVIFCCAVSSST